MNAFKLDDRTIDQAFKHLHDFIHSSFALSIRYEPGTTFQIGTSKSAHVVKATKDEYTYFDFALSNQTHSTLQRNRYDSLNHHYSKTVDKYSYAQDVSMILMTSSYPKDQVKPSLLLLCDEELYIAFTLGSKWLLEENRITVLGSCAIANDPAIEFETFENAKCIFEKL